MKKSLFNSNSQKKIEKIEPLVKPMKTAALVSLLFFIAGVAYILLSSHIAALVATTVEGLAFIEKIKGFVFILSISLLLFFIMYAFLSKIGRQERILLNFGNRLIAAERRATAAVFADSVAHNIGNVVMNLEYYTDELARATGREKTAELENINNSIARLNRMVKRLGNVSGRLGEEHKEFFNLPVALKDALGFARRHRDLRLCKVSFDGPEELMFMGNLLLVYQMTINLVMNAAEATGYRGEIRVRLFERNDDAVVEVHDNGPGIEESRHKAVLEPFYTTKENKNGLGLLSVQACAHFHRGKVEIGDSDLGGACFAVYLKKTPPVTGAEEV